MLACEVAAAAAAEMFLYDGAASNPLEVNVTMTWDAPLA